MPQSILFYFVSCFFSIDGFSEVLPSKKIAFVTKNKSYKETMKELFVSTDMKVRFAKDLQLEEKVEVRVERLAWDAIFHSLLQPYGLKYRFLSSKLIEIYKE